MHCGLYLSINHSSEQCPQAVSVPRVGSAPIPAATPDTTTAVNQHSGAVYFVNNRGGPKCTFTRCNTHTYASTARETTQRQTAHETAIQLQVQDGRAHTSGEGRESAVSAIPLGHVLGRRCIHGRSFVLWSVLSAKNIHGHSRQSLLGTEVAGRSVHRTLLGQLHHSGQAKVRRM